MCQCVKIFIFWPGEYQFNCKKMQTVWQMDCDQSGRVHCKSLSILEGLGWPSFGESQLEWGGWNMVPPWSSSHWNSQKSWNIQCSKRFQTFHFRSFLWFTKLKGVNVVYINWYSSRFTKNGIFRRFHFWSKRGLRNRGAQTWFTKKSFSKFTKNGMYVVYEISSFMFTKNGTLGVVSKKH